MRFCPAETSGQKRGKQSPIRAIGPRPGTAAQEVTNRLVNCGIAGILNFAPIVLQVPEDVTVNNVNVAIELENLSYFIQD